MTSTLTPTFIVKDQEHKPMMKIEGSLIRLFDKDFAIYDLSAQSALLNCNQLNYDAQQMSLASQIGRITEESRFFGHDVWLTFPRNLTVTAKATLLATIFLLEVLYFETTFPKAAVSRVFV